MLEYTRHFLISLPLTVATETVVLVFLVRKIFRIEKEDLSLYRLLFSGWFASFATIPYVWYVFPILIYSSYAAAIWAGECFAVVVEAIFYAVFLKLNIKRSIAVSFLANAASYLLVPFLLRAMS